MWPAISRCCGLRAKLVFDRDTASRLGITPSAIDQTLYDAYGQRQVSTMFTQLNQYHVVLEVKPEFQQEPVGPARSVHPHRCRRVRPGWSRADVGDAGLSDRPARRPRPSVSASCVFIGAAHRHRPRAARSAERRIVLDGIPERRPGAARAPSRTWRRPRVPITVNHQGQFPVVTLSFNLAPNASLGDAVKAVNKVKSEIGMPPSIQAAFQGTAEAFQASLANEPVLILAALITVYIVLGVLYESYIHPITILSTLPSAGVGALLALIICRQRLQRHRADRHRPADRHREEERHHDDRLRAGSRAQGRHDAGGRHLSGLPAALPPHHDDHHGGAAGRAFRWRSAPAPVRSCAGRLGITHHRRTDPQPVADALHDAGHLSLVRSAGDGDSRRSTEVRRRARSRFRRTEAMNISEPFIRRPVATTLLTVAIALAGAVAFRLLPVSPLPQVDFPTISVSAGLPGASPETMASSVATPLERQFGRIAAVTEMTSSSSLGSTSITLQFDLNRNIDAAARDVQAAINAARGYLPANLPNNPTYRKVNPADSPIFMLALTSRRPRQGPDVRRRLDDHGAEAVAGERRGPGDRGRQLAARRSHRTESDGAEQVRHRPRAGAQRAEQRQCQHAQRTFFRRPPHVGSRRQRSDLQGRRLRAADRRLPQRIGRARLRRRPGGGFGAKTFATRATPTASPPFWSSSSASPAPTSSTPWIASAPCFRS